MIPVHVEVEISSKDVAEKRDSFESIINIITIFRYSIYCGLGVDTFISKSRY